MERLNLTLLGGFQGRTGVGAALRLPTRRGQALLAFLALPPGRWHPREKLASLLWGGTGAPRARRGLRQALFTLRKAVATEPPALLITGDTVALNPTSVDVDVVEFERGVAEGTPAALERATSLYRGDLLEGLELQEAPFEEWLLAERERLRELALEALAQLLRHQRTTGTAEAAVATALRLLALDPLQEPVHRALMRLYTQLGRRTAALRQYQLCVGALQRELGVEPETTTKQLYQEILRQRPSQTARRTAEPAPVQALVGREAELEQLDGWLALALTGERQIVFVTGESGIGKTTVVDAFLARRAAGEGLRVGSGQCVERYGAGDAYLPVLDALSRLGRGRSAQRVVEVLSRHAPTWLVQLPALVTAGELRALQRGTGAVTRERMLRELTEAIEVLASDEPLVLRLEDLHWSDVSTLDWLSFLARRPEPARLLVVGTYRPVEMLSTDHPLRTVKQELQLHQRCRELALRPLDRAAVSQYLARRFPVDVAQAPVLERLGQAIHGRTDGNPLFMVNVTDDLVAQGVLTEHGGRWNVAVSPERVPLGVPAHVGQMIERQLDRLGAAERRTLEVASVAGGEFSAAVVAGAAAVPPTDVEAACSTLARREQFLKTSGTAEWPDGTLATSFTFLHALYREVLYERVPAGTRAELHARVGDRLETGYGERAGEIAAELAMHFERGRQTAKAVRYLREAGRNAMGRSAHAEAIAHLTRGLDLLPTLPDTSERVRCETELLAMLGPAWMAAKGYAAREVAATYGRALELCRHLDETPERVRAIKGLWNFYLVRSELGTARDLCEELLEVARRRQDNALLRLAHAELGQTLFHVGEFGPARAHLEQALASEVSGNTATTTADPRVLAYLGWTLWQQGLPDQARQRSDEALAMAQRVWRPHQLAFVLGFAAFLNQFCRDPDATLRLAGWQDALCREHGYPYWLSWSVMLRGWVLAQRGKTEDGLARIREGLEAYRSTGAEVGLAHFSGLLVEALAAGGRIDEASTVAEEALALSARNGNRYWDAELLRLKGELCLARPGAMASAEAEAVFHEARTVAHSQGALSLELRAAMRLAGLWSRQDRRADARHVLAEVCGRFTEGLGTADVLEARALLAQLSQV